MDTQYADAIIALEEAIASATFRAERSGLTEKEIADELRRTADQLDPSKRGRAK